MVTIANFFLYKHDAGYHGLYSVSFVYFPESTLTHMDIKHCSTWRWLLQPKHVADDCLGLNCLGIKSLQNCSRDSPGGRPFHSNFQHNRRC